MSNHPDQPEDCCDGDDYDDDPFADECYDCGGARWKVTCIDDMCHGQDYCIHGDPPTPCRTCNKDGGRDGCYFQMQRPPVR